MSARDDLLSIASEQLCEGHETQRRIVWVES